MSNGTCRHTALLPLGGQLSFSSLTGSVRDIDVMNRIWTARTAIGFAIISASSFAVAEPIARTGERPIGRGEVAAFVNDQFAAADTDKNGIVAKAELQSFRDRLDEQDRSTFDDIVAQSFEQADIDADGEIARWEVDQRASQLFDLVDVDQDGIASVEEQTTAAALANLDASDFERLLDRFGFGTAWRN